MNPESAVIYNNCSHFVFHCTYAKNILLYIYIYIRLLSLLFLYSTLLIDQLPSAMISNTALLPSGTRTIFLPL